MADDHNRYENFHLTSTEITEAIWKLVVNLPHIVGCISNFCRTRNIAIIPKRIIASRLTTIRVTHNGNLIPVSTIYKKMNALIRRTLSPKGSKTKPAGEYCLLLRAMYPSTASEKTADINIARAINLI